MPRTADLVVAGVVLVVLSPLLLVLAALVAVTSRGPVLYRQVRVGRQSRPFTLLKFRTMRVGTDVSGRLTVGDRDPRTTAVGRVLRRHKLDELPQLVNVLRGDMALVGPRPEVPEFALDVPTVTPDRRVVQAARPGLTDPASLRFRRESELLAGHPDPERYYREVLLPAKLAVSADYLRHRSVRSDVGVLWSTALALVGRGPSVAAADRDDVLAAVPDRPAEPTRGEQRS